jgi:hypothetical protein
VSFLVESYAVLLVAYYFWRIYIKVVRRNVFYVIGVFRAKSEDLILHSPWGGGHIERARPFRQTGTRVGPVLDSLSLRINLTFDSVTQIVRISSQLR